MKGRSSGIIRSGGVRSFVAIVLCLAAMLAVSTGIASSRALAADAVTKVEQTDTRLSYAGSWSTFSTASASSGSYKRANTNGSSVTVTFNGTYLAWIATKGTTLGKAFVSLDGGAAVSVNLAASSVAYQQKVWNTGTLASGTHTVKIWWDPSNLTGKYISVDAFEVAGTLTQTTVNQPAGGATRYQQTDSHLAYQAPGAPSPPPGPRAGAISGRTPTEAR